MVYNVVYCSLQSAHSLTCTGGLCSTPQPCLHAGPHSTLRPNGLVVAIITSEHHLVSIEESVSFPLGIGRGTRVTTAHFVCVYVCVCFCVCVCVYVCVCVCV